MVLRSRLSLVLILSFFAVAFISSAALAKNDEFALRMAAVRDSVSKYEEAVFNLTVVNIQDYEEQYSIYSPNVDTWVVIADPARLDLLPNTAGYSIIRIKAKAGVAEGRDYGVQLNVRAMNTSTLDKAYAFLSILTQDDINRGYTPVVSIDAPLDMGKLDPTEPQVLEFTLENKNVRNLERLEVRLSSGNFNAEKFTDLGPLKTVTVQIPIAFKESTPAQKDTFILEIRYNNSTLLSRSIAYEIAGVQKSEYHEETARSLLLTEKKVTFTNTANLGTTAEYRVGTNLLNYFFIHGNAKSRLALDHGKLYKVYYAPLMPDSEYILYVNTSYRILLYLVIAFAIIICLYYALRSPIVLQKTVSSIASRPDSMSEMKVMLHIKNRSRKTFEELIIMDRVPRIIDMDNRFDIGTIRPAKIVSNEKKGVIAKWQINVLDSYEERVIVYKVVTAMKILGGLTLPNAIIKYRSADGREKTVSSKSVRVVLNNTPEELPEEA